MKRLTALCVVVASAWASACGGGGSSTAPTTVMPLAVAPTTTVLVAGQTQAYQAANLATLDNVVTWTSSDPSVLMIDDTGTATAIAKGFATITVTTSVQSAALVVQVVPNYQGTWTGKTTSAACTSISGFASYCSQSLGAAQSLTLNLTQSGLLISGLLTKSETGGVISGPVGGSIGPGGDVTLTGILTGVSSGANIVAALISWNSLAIDTNMTGIWAANVTSSQILGIATVQWSLTGVTLAR